MFLLFNISIECGLFNCYYCSLESFYILIFYFVYFLIRLISDRTVEENILKKANQKRLLGDLAIEGGNFNTAFFKKVSNLCCLLAISLSPFFRSVLFTNLVQGGP